MSYPRYRGIVRGFVAYHEKQDARPAAIFIDEIAVARRGEGLGSHLLSPFAGRTVELRVHFNNKSAAAMYEKFGFEPCMGQKRRPSVFGYDEKRGYRCRICNRLPRTDASTHGDLSSFDCWNDIPRHVQRDIKALTHRAHRSFTVARVRDILLPMEGPPCRFFVAMAAG